MKQSMLTSKVGNRLNSVFAPIAKASPAQTPVAPSIISVNDPAKSSALVDATLKKLLALPVSISANNQVSASVQPPPIQSDLDLLDEVLTQTEATDLEKPADDVDVQPEKINYVASGGKESLGAISAVDSVVVEAGGNAQMVEYEPNPELSPEVEGYINRVDQNTDQAPNEIVIADASMPMPSNHQLPSQPVLVLPITVGLEKEGATQSPKFSVRWLVEWSRKIIKIFVGKVIYRQN